MAQDVIYSAPDATGNVGVWSSDGASQGTTELLSGEQGQDSLSPTQFTDIGDQTLFEGKDSTGNDYLWVTNGTPTGTLELGAIFPYDFTPLEGGEALLLAQDNGGGGFDGVWVTNGTAEGTFELVPST